MKPEITLEVGESQRLAIGQRVQIISGNAKGKTGIIESKDSHFVYVKSDETGNVRRFVHTSVALLPQLEALLPKTETLSPQAEALLPQIPEALKSAPDAPSLEALLPQLEALLPLAQSYRPLPGWLAEEPGRSPRWCRREGGQIICSVLEGEQVELCRRSLRAGRVVAALRDAIRAIGE